MAAQASPMAPSSEPLVPRSWRVDPTGRVVLPEVPDDLLQRWREDRAAVQAELAEAAVRHAAEVRDLAARIGSLRSLVFDGYMIGQDLRGLTYLFDKAVTDDGDDGMLSAGGRVVVDCMRTMAARLEALEGQADATRETGGAA